METILALQPTQRDPNRVMVRVGVAGKSKKGRVAATLPASVVSDMRLRLGMVWEEPLAQAVDEQREDDRCFRAAARRLGRRAMSVGMLDDKLKQLDPPPSARSRQRAIERLQKLDLIDDASFARAVVRETTRSKPAGERLLSMKLRQKKVSPEIIEQVLRELQPSKDDALEAAFQFAKKRVASMHRLDPQVMQRRLYGQLARRGLSPETCRQVFDMLKSST